MMLEKHQRQPLKVRGNPSECLLSNLLAPLEVKQSSVDECPRPYRGIIEADHGIKIKPVREQISKRFSKDKELRGRLRWPEAVSRSLSDCR